MEEKFKERRDEELKAMVKEHQELEEARINLIHKTKSFNHGAKSFLINHKMVEVLSINWDLLRRIARNY